MRAGAGKQRVRDARAELYRGLLIKAGEALFSRVGFASAKVQDIAREAGLSLATFYACFRSKKELFLAIGAVRHEALLAQLAAIQAGGLAPERALAAAVETAARFYAERPELLRVLLRDGRNWAQDKSLSEPERESWHAGIGQFQALFRRGIRAGAFVPQDPGLMALTIAAMLQVHLAHWLEHDGRDPAPMLAELRETVLRAFLRTAGARRATGR